MTRSMKKYGHIAALVLIFAQLQWIAGCTYYDLARHSPNAVTIKPSKVVYIHGKSGVVALNSISFSAAALSGKVQKIFADYKMPPLDARGGSPALAEVHIFADSLELPLDSLKINANYSVPMTDLKRVYQYDLNTDKTILVNLAVAVGASAVIFATIVLIVLLTKSSCPFIYSYNGSTCTFEGEIFSGAIHPPLERDDYLFLSHLSTENNAGTVKITNEVREIQHTNLVELLAVDHGPGERMIADRQGNLHAIGAPEAPLYVHAPGGKDVGAIVAAIDSSTYMSDVVSRNQIMDSLVMAFKVPRGSRDGKLVLRMRNSFWLDYTYGRFLDLFGNEIGYWNRMMDKSKPETMLKWKLEQGFPLTVSAADHGKWNMVDYCYEAGPMGMRDFVIPVPLSGVKSDTLQVKLQFGALFWEIDYAAMDFTPDTGFTVTTIACNRAVDRSGTDIKRLIDHDDSAYYHQPSIGDEATIAFPIPAALPDKARSYILHSKGYYTILRQPEGAPRISYLKSFKKPGRFVDFSNECFKSLVDMVTRPSGVRGAGN